MSAASRRGLLRLGAAAPFAALVPMASAPSPAADAALLVLGTALTAAWRAETDAWQRVGSTPAEEDALWAEAEKLQERTSAIVDSIRDAVATTLHGILVKVRALHWCRSGDDVESFDLGDDGHGLTTDVELVLSLVRDLSGMTGRVA